MMFGVTLGRDQDHMGLGSFLTLHLGISFDGAQGTLWVAGDGTDVGCC